LPDPVLEGRARTISADLRCLVCQNQSIDDSAAPLARDLRLIVRERLKAGDTDGQVRAYLVARYGDFVLLKPPFKLETLMLWGTPLLVVILGGFGLWWRARSGVGQRTAPLDAEEERRLKALLQEP
jgi:cytochrome c-type biogenesis protein CcmH